VEALKRGLARADLLAQQLTIMFGPEHQVCAEFALCVKPLARSLRAASLHSPRLLQPMSGVREGDGVEFWVGQTEEWDSDITEAVRGAEIGHYGFLIEAHDAVGAPR
jgi:hypothetical protein